MTTQSKISSPVEVAHERKLSWLLAMGILLVGIVLGVFASNLSAIASKIGISGAPVGEISNFVPQLEKQAIIAGETQVERVRQAEAARYTSLGQYYAAGNEANVQRAIVADSARYNGLAEYYRAVSGPQSLAWPPRPAQFQPTEISTVSLDENALAAYHQSEWSYAIVEAGVPQHDREYGLAAFGPIEIKDHTLAWPPRPAQFQPAEISTVSLDENALAAYHQSEWGLASEKADTDRDIGLMEFFPTGK
jgi:hypothetical protein